MKTIVSITFSPTIDKSVSIPRMLPETKIKCSNLELYPGGGGINIARVLTRFDADIIALFPANRIRIPFFKTTLSKEKVKNMIVECQNETRESIEIYETFSGKQFRLVMPNSDLTTSEWEELLQALVEIKQIDFVVVSGSFPTNSPINIFGRLAQIADSKKAKLIVDTSGESLKKAIRESLYLIKPNLEEFSHLIGNSDLKIADLKEAAMTFLEKNKCELVVISLGKKGAVLYSKMATYHIKAPKVVVKSTVGAGDSMLAGIIYGLSLDMGLRECLKYGIAFGTATTLQSGTALCTQKDVEELLPKIVNQR